MLRIAVVVPVLIAVTVGTVAVVRSGPWRDGSVHGRWRTVFAGYGDVRGGDDEVTLEPRAAQGEEHTHAALIATTTTYSDLALSASVNTERQLRSGQPNAWEVGWVLWHYQDPQHFYALVLKPSGWELSKQDPAYPKGQRFLASGTTPTFATGRWHTVSVVQIGASIKASADGSLLTAVSDTERPYLTGAAGLYCEDARVHFKDLQILSLPSQSQENKA